MKGESLPSAATRFVAPATPTDAVLLDASADGYERGQEILDLVDRVGSVLEADSDQNGVELRELLHEGFCFLLSWYLVEEESLESPTELAENFGRYLAANRFTRFDRQIAREHWQEIFQRIRAARSDGRVAREVTDALLC